jgi:hypothetical protein
MSSKKIKLKHGGKYKIMFNHEVFEYEYDGSTHSCEHQIKESWNYFQFFYETFFRILL